MRLVASGTTGPSSWEPVHLPYNNCLVFCQQGVEWNQFCIGDWTAPLYLPPVFPIHGISKGMPRPGRNYLNNHLIESGLVRLIATSKVSAPMDKALALVGPTDVDILMGKASVTRKWVYLATGGSSLIDRVYVTILLDHQFLYTPQISFTRT